MLNFPRWKILVVFVTCLAAIYLAVPNLLKPADDLLNKLFPSKRVNLGLDLQGGSYLLLDVDFNAYMDEQARGLVDEVRLKLRENKVGYIGLQPKGNAVSLILRDQAQEGELRDTIRSISRDLNVNKAGSELEISYGDDYIKDTKRRVLEQSLEIVRRRIDETGTKEPIIQSQGETQILLQVPGLDNPDNLKTLLGKTAKLTFHLMDETDPFPATSVPSSPDIMMLTSDSSQTGETTRNYAVKRTAMLTGDMLVDARASFEGAMPIVNFKFNNLGAKKFGDITRDNVGKPFAIVLDDKVISAPVIREPILGGSGMISGNFTVQSASNLALLLRAGALPAPIKIIEERTVGPSLGQDSIDSGKKAAIIGTILVMAFMIINYGLFGLFANIALVMNIIIIFSVLSLFEATLTLPGIAGIVLTIGMAVDANVLIFERVREEIRMGRSAFAGIDQGFKMAFNTIFDSHVTTLIVALILFALGSGTVKGFAVTMAIGIIASLFTAVMLTRLMVVTWLKTYKPRTIPI